MAIDGSQFIVIVVPGISAVMIVVVVLIVIAVLVRFQPHSANEMKLPWHACNQRCRIHAEQRPRLQRFPTNTTIRAASQSSILANSQRNPSSEPAKTNGQFHFKFLDRNRDGPACCLPVNAANETTKPMADESSENCEEVKLPAGCDNAERCVNEDCSNQPWFVTTNMASAHELRGHPQDVAARPRN